MYPFCCSGRRGDGGSVVLKFQLHSIRAVPLPAIETFRTSFSFNARAQSDSAFIPIFDECRSGMCVFFVRAAWALLDSASVHSMFPLLIYVSIWWRAGASKLTHTLNRHVNEQV